MIFPVVHLCTLHKIPGHTPLCTVRIPSHSNFHQYQLILNTHTLSARADLHCIFPPHDALAKMSNMAVPRCKIDYLTRVQKIPEKEVLSIAEVSLRLQVFDRVLHVVSIRTGIAFKYRFQIFRSNHVAGQQHAKVYN